MSADRGFDAGSAGLSPGQVLRRHSLLILAITLIATGVATAIALTREPTYRASIQIIFRPPGPEFGVLGLAPSGGDPSREAATNVVQVRSRAVAAAAARELGEEDVDALQRRLTIEAASPDANVVDVAAEDSTVEGAQRTVIVYATTFRRQRRDAEIERARGARMVLEARYDELSAIARRAERGLRLLDQIEQLAVLEEIGTGSPDLLGRPQSAARVDEPRQLILLGGLLGLVLGVGLAYLRATSDRRVRGDEDLAGASPTGVVATIPRSRALRRHVPFAELPAEDREAFRRLYARLRFARDQPRVVVVTSAREGEGKTTVAANLAAAAVSSGEPVLLIEADLRAPALSERLQLSPSAGLVQLLEGRTELPPGPNGKARLQVLGAGGASAHPAALLQSDRMNRLLEDAGQTYALVVVDTPAIGQVSDAIPLVRYADGVLLSTLAGHSDRRETAQLAAEVLEMGGRVVGIVVNGADRGDGSPTPVGAESSA